MSNAILGHMLPATDRDSWWDKSNRFDNSVQNNQGSNALTTLNNPSNSFSQSLESILSRSDSFAVNKGSDFSQSAPSSVSGEAVTFEELINSQNAQIREFAVLDQQPLSNDWSVLSNANPVTPSNFKALQGLSDGLMLSQRFANAIVAV